MIPGADACEYTPVLQYSLLDMCRWREHRGYGGRGGGIEGGGGGRGGRGRGGGGGEGRRGEGGNKRLVIIFHSLFYLNTV